MGVSKFVRPLYSIGPNKRRHWHTWCGLTFISFTIEYFPHTLAKKPFILQIGNTENNTYFLPCVQAKFLACWLSAIFWVFNGKRPTQMLNMTIVYTLFLTIYYPYLFSINTGISAAIKFTWLCNNVVGGTGFLAIHLVLWSLFYPAHMLPIALKYLSKRKMPAKSRVSPKCLL